MTEPLLNVDRAGSFLKFFNFLQRQVSSSNGLWSLLTKSLGR